MKKMKVIIFTVLSTLLVMVVVESIAGYYDIPRPKDDEVGISCCGIAVPLNRILLIRKGTKYCAVKFTRFWVELDEKRLKTYSDYIAKHPDSVPRFRELSERKFALYTSFYQDDGTGDFSNKNVQVIQGKASWFPLEGSSRFFLSQPGNPYVQFGRYKLGWQDKTEVMFIPPDKGEGEYGFELTPTPWTDIKEVNIKDPRIKWYQKDEKREMTFIPIDKLWNQ